MAGDAVRVDGLRKFTTALNNIGVELDDLKNVMGDVGEVVASAARPLTRPKSGQLAGTIRPSRTKNKAVVRAGTARAPYAGVIHFGWAARNIRPNPYLYIALDKRRDEVLQRFDQEIASLVTKG